MPTITCTRCGKERDQLPFPPFQNDIGKRVFGEICAVCWGEWLKLQQQLINHHGLNVMDPRAKQFLYANLEQFLFQGTGTQGSPVPPARP